MSHLFNLTLATKYGEMETSVRANSLEQITSNLPSEFIDCTAAIVSGSGDDQVVSVEDLMPEFISVMNLIEDHPRIQALLSN